MQYLFFRESLAHTTITDLSTGGDTIGSITGSFSSTGSGWRTGDTTHWNDTEWAFAPNDGNTATFTFSGLAEGTEWDIFTTWKLQANRSAAVPYTIDGGANIEINQRLAPTADLVLDDGTDAANSSYNFQKIGTATVVGGEIVVTIGSAPVTDNNDWVMADGIAIQEVPEPSSAALLGLGGLALILRRRK